MKLKTIQKTLQAKFEAWAASLPEPLREQVKKNTIITGGSIVSMLLKEKVNDFDLYFRDFDTCLAVARHYANLPALKGMVSIRAEDGRISIRTEPNITYQGEEEASDESQEAAEDEKFEPLYMSSNAITLSGQIQLVCRFYGEPEEIHKNYDFVHCTNYWKSWDGELVVTKEALSAILTRELFYVGSKYPLCSLIRIRKFIQRGWTINAGQMLKMVMQLNELDLSNVDVLRDQLVGVDSAYFAMLIAAIEKAEPEKINASYLSEIIDRIF